VGATVSRGLCSLGQPWQPVRDLELHRRHLGLGQGLHDVSTPPLDPPSQLLPCHCAVICQKFNALHTVTQARLSDAFATVLCFNRVVLHIVTQALLTDLCHCAVLFFHRVVSQHRQVVDSSRQAQVSLLSNSAAAIGLQIRTICR